MTRWHGTDGLNGLFLKALPTAEEVNELEVCWDKFYNILTRARRPASRQSNIFIGCDLALRYRQHEIVHIPLVGC